MHVRAAPVLAAARPRTRPSSLPEDGPSAKPSSRGSEPEGGRAGAPGSADGRRRVLGRPCGAPVSERGRTRVDGVCRACRGSSPAASTVVQTASRSTVVGCWSWMLVRCKSAQEEVIVQVSLVISSSKSRVAATWLGGVDCDVASRQSSSSRIRLGWRHPLDLAGGAAVSTSTRCDRPLHSVLGTGWEASCAKTASILVGAEGRTALLHDLLAGRKKPPLNLFTSNKTPHRRTS